MAVAVATWWISWESWANSVPFLGRLLSVFALGARCSKKKLLRDVGNNLPGDQKIWVRSKSAITHVGNMNTRLPAGDGEISGYGNDVDMVIATLRCHLNRETFDKSVVVSFLHVLL